MPLGFFPQKCYNIYNTYNSIIFSICCVVPYQEKTGYLSVLCIETIYVQIIPYNKNS